MPRFPLPRRGVRSLLIVGLMMWTGYLLVKRLDAVSNPSHDLEDGDGGGGGGMLGRGALVNPFQALGLRGGGSGGKGQVLEPPRERAQVPLKRPNRSGKGGLADVGRKAGKGDAASRSRKKSNRLPEHRFLNNGLLKVNPEGQHPIFDLVGHATEKWQAKLDKASKTLKDAVDEYRRRYGRAPPKGFDKWWAYAEKHNVQLPDEYDQIFHDLEPFHALRPAKIRALVEQAKKVDGSYVITCSEGKCTNSVNLNGLNEEGTRVIHDRVIEQFALIKEIQGELEPVDAVYYSHDVPWQFVGHEFRSALEDSASVGEYYDVDEHEYDHTHLGWASACPPHKPLRESYDSSVLPVLDEVWQDKQKTFVWDHQAAMDVCTHPTMTHLQGHLLGHGKGPGPSKEMLPMMAMCKTTLHADILAVSMEAWTEGVGEDLEWDAKPYDRLLWRGRTTGVYFDDKVPWELSQRMNLIERGGAETGSVPVLSLTPPNSPVGEPDEHELRRLNDDMIDVGFVDQPIQCDPEVCDQIRERYKHADRKTWTDANKYKYSLDLDGNGWSARFKRLMTSNAAILKSTIFPEWYTDRVQPWVHYIPVKSDLTDLYDIMTFFRGHDGMGKKIAVDGTKWSQTFWRREDLISYQFRLMLELSRLMAKDRAAASFNVMGKHL